MTNNQKVVKYLTLIQLVYEMSDDQVIKDTYFNTKVISQRCTDLMLSIKKQIWRVYRGNKDGIWKVDDFKREEDFDLAVEQHYEAVQQMNKLFDIGLQISELDDVKVQGFQSQLTLLLKYYGIEIDDLE